MGVVGHGLRVLRLVLLGGTLAVLWLLLSAAESKAAPGHPDPSVLPVEDAPLVRTVREPVSPNPSREALPHNPVRAVDQARERAVPVVEDAADATLDVAQRAASVVVGEAKRTATPLRLDPVVRPVLSTTEAVSTGLHEGASLTLDEAVDLVGTVPVVPGEGASPEPPPTDDAASRPSASKAVEETETEAPDRSVAKHAVPEPTAEATTRDAAQQTSSAPWELLAGLVSSGDGTATRALDEGEAPALPQMPAPSLPMAVGCAPTTSAAGGGFPDEAAERNGVVVVVAPTLHAGAESRTASAPGPAALPDVSPE